MDEVGRLYLSSGPESQADWTASLLLPEDAVTQLASCFGVVTKYLFIRFFDADANEASIDHYAFSGSTPKGGATVALGTSL
jgi:hypothetical protein